MGLIERNVMSDMGLDRDPSPDEKAIIQLWFKKGQDAFVKGSD